MMSTRILVGDVRDRLSEFPDDSINCVVTSPPYWGLRDYGCEGQIGLEKTFDDFLRELVAVFDEVRRVLLPDGVAWVNMGDSYAVGGKSGPQGSTGDRASRTFTATGLSSTRGHGAKPKDLIGQPWALAFALRDSGWYLRSDVIWHKPNPMPESVADRPTKSHEYVFLLTKSERYKYDADAIAEPSTGRASGNVDVNIGARVDGQKMRTRANLHAFEPTDTRNARTVWTIPTQPNREAHFATFPEALAERCIRAGCPEGGTVLDPFLGSGTTALVAAKLGRSSIGVEINPEYAALAERRVRDNVGLLSVVEVDR